MFPRVDIEPTFDSIIGECGGVRVADLVGSSPTFRNADYLFRDERVIAELKCLEVDKSHDPGVARKVKNHWIKWRQKGLVSGEVPRRIDSRALPTICQTELYNIVGEPIRKRLQKANRQIRETKAALHLDDYTGLLLIANDGNFAMHPAAMIHYIQSSLQKEFREIHNFIFFTVNMPSRMTNTPQPVYFWITFSVSEEHTLPEAFLNRLHDTWVRRQQKLTGIPGIQVDRLDMKAFWDATY